MRKMKDLLVKDICSKGVKSINQNSNVKDAASIMSENEIGAVLIVDDNNLPIGIVTNDDIIQKVVQYDKLPNQVKIAEVMSFPLLTIDPEQNIIEAMRKMANNDVKRLIVSIGEKPYGVLSSSDILEHSPDYIEILKEIIEIAEESLDNQNIETFTGYCQICGAWSDDLRESDEGTFVCSDCL
ncbi:MAG: CBS domain-containing protein [Candidatus Lokiarchaeota archaeon]|nr:CBS domain-containing protein [Candidatus Lokiarchaeota archaeon]